MGQERVLSTSEEIANSVTHGLGLIASLVALPILIAQQTHAEDLGHVVGRTVFAASLVALYAASTVYHALPHSRAKHIFRAIDHSAIYLLIAGTYTPFALGVLRGAWGWSLLTVIWALAGFGIVQKARSHGQDPRASVWLYIVMGWLGVVAAQPVVANMAGAGIAWIVAGGILYTGGVAFFAWERRYSHAVWHLFVLGGSACHFFAVLWYARPLVAF